MQNTLPKIELHVHLDCCLSYEVVRELHCPLSLQEFRNTYVAPEKCLNLADFLEKVTASIELLQTRRALEIATLGLFRQLKQDGVLYAEIRFAPLLHTQQRMSPEEVVETLCKAVARGRQETGVWAELLICTLRHHTFAQSMETVHLAEAFFGQGVVGFDIAGDEAAFPIDNHIAAFEYAHRCSIPCTAHAGEARGPESVWETLRYFKPSRIGHGVRCIEDPALVAQLADQGIHLEVCPTSNVQTNVYSQLKDHPIDQLYKAGISIGINTDGRTLTNVSLEDEYQHLHQAFGWGKTQWLQCNLNALAASFTTTGIKAAIKRKLLTGYGD